SLRRQPLRRDAGRRDRAGAAGEPRRRSLFHAVVDRWLGRMAQAVDLVHLGSLESVRRDDLSRPALAPETREWLSGLGIEPNDSALWLEALTHGSTGADANYERLEFLGDRVLGLSIAEWLYRNEDGPEGKLSQRLNALVSREMCAEIARRIGLPGHIQLGKQAREDGGIDSD